MHYLWTFLDRFADGFAWGIGASIGVLLVLSVRTLIG